jgi:DNA-directed RNA polymerase subunit RPC12/RpoP
MSSRIKIKKTLLGKLTVAYNCPKCDTRLVSDFANAGETEECPSCKEKVFVPGQSTAEITQSVFGKLTVEYDCTQCRTSVSSNDLTPLLVPA